MRPPVGVKFTANFTIPTDSYNAFRREVHQPALSLPKETRVKADGVGAGEWQNPPTSTLGIMFITWCNYIILVRMVPIQRLYVFFKVRVETPRQLVIIDFLYGIREVSGVISIPK